MVPTSWELDVVSLLLNYHPAPGIADRCNYLG